jgi:carbon-monoxide dehydrogenase large subunit
LASVAQAIILSGSEEQRQQWVGKRVKRKEDLRLVRGAGNYVDDFNLPNQLHVAIVRSPYPHATIKKIDCSKALALPGVYAALTGEEVAEKTAPFSQIVPPPGSKLHDYCLAVGKVRFIGEPVVAIAARDRQTAEDAVELVEVEYEILPPVVDVEMALEEDSPLVHEEVGSNVLWHDRFNYGNVDLAFEEADLVVEERLHFHRFSSMPLETNAILADYSMKSQQLTVWSNNHMPMFSSMLILDALKDFPSEKLRLITPDAGGHFGIKVTNYPYIVLVSLLSMKTGRPVKWYEDRREHIAAAGHGSERHFQVKMAVKKDGAILGYKLRTMDDEGAYLRYEPVGVMLFVHVAFGPYKIRNGSFEVFAVSTNKCPVSSNRGYGRMQHEFMIERMVDIVAKRLGLDPTEVRFRNFIQPKEFPYETATGAIYDSGDYPQSLRLALQAMDYDSARRRQKEMRKQGKFLGVGVSTVVESGTNNFSQVRLINPHLKVSGSSEVATVKIDHRGSIIALCGSVPGGQGHETTIAQIVADELGVSPYVVNVLTFDSSTHGWTVQSGTFATRFAVMGVGATLGAAKKLKKKVLAIASHALGVPEENLVLLDGFVKVRDSNRSMSFADVANLAYTNTALLPDGIEAGLFETYVFRPNFKLADERKRGNLMLTYGYQTHAALVEIDGDSGTIKILKYVVVHDSGKQLNPLIVEGQVHGACAHSIFASLFERFDYDANGELLASTFMDYLVPTAKDVPDIETIHIETPSPFSPLGAKGCGEGAGGPLSAIANAVEDALSPLGLAIRDTHLSPEIIFNLLHKNT